MYDVWCAFDGRCVVQGGVFGAGWCVWCRVVCVVQGVEDGSWLVLQDALMCCEAAFWAYDQWCCCMTMAVMGVVEL